MFSSFFSLSSVRSEVDKMRFYREEQFSHIWDEFRLDLWTLSKKENPLTFHTVTMGTQRQVSSWDTFPQHGPDPHTLQRHPTIKPDKANIMPKKLFHLKSDMALCPGSVLSLRSCEYVHKCNDYHSMFVCGGLAYP